MQVVGTQLSKHTVSIHEPSEMHAINRLLYACIRVAPVASSKHRGPVQTCLVKSTLFGLISTQRGRDQAVKDKLHGFSCGGAAEMKGAVQSTSFHYTNTCAACVLRVFSTQMAHCLAHCMQTERNFTDYRTTMQQIKGAPQDRTGPRVCCSLKARTLH